MAGPVEPLSFRELMARFPRAGQVAWIGLRPGRREPVVSVASASARPGEGLAGDHYSGKGGRRQVTLVQWEHLDAVASMLGIEAVHPSTLRRNVAVRGVNLLALKGREFRIGEAVLECTGLCHPCAFMEEALGLGGYNAMRGHGGITARVITGGLISIGSPVLAVTD